MKTKVSSPALDWLIAAIAVIGCCMLIQLMTSCKKEPIVIAATASGGSTSATNHGYASGTVTVSVNSNYLRSCLQVTNTTDNVSVLTYNYGAAHDGDCPYAMTFVAQADKKYKIYTYSTKNSTDSTAFMVDAKPVWNSIKVQFGSTTVTTYQHIDSIGTGTWRICKNNYNLN